MKWGFGIFELENRVRNHDDVSFRVSNWGIFILSIVQGNNFNMKRKNKHCMVSMDEKFFLKKVEVTRLIGRFFPLTAIEG